MILSRAGIGSSPRAVAASFESAAAMAALAVAALSGLACRQTPPLIRYDDVVTDRAAAIGPGSWERDLHHCGDATSFSLRVEAGLDLRYTLDLGAAPRLFVDSCEASATPGPLLVEVRDEEGLALAAELPPRGGPGWTRHELDLGRFAGRRVHLALAPAPPRRATLFFRELHVRHRPAAPPLPPPPGATVRGEPWRAPAVPPLPPRPVSRTDPAEAPATQVLLVSVDALRADAVGALSTPRPERSPTPSLDAFAAAAETFSPSYAAAAWTLPSHGSLLTGYPVPVHRMDLATPLPAFVPTLAERLAATGLATAAIVHDCAWLNPGFGLDRGFHSYRSERWSAGQIARAAANWVAAHRDRPFFLFVHVFDVHSDFHRLPYEGSGASTGEIQRLFGVEEYGCRGGRCASDLLRRILDREIDPIPGEAEILRHLYLGGVSEVDAALGSLFADLREMGVLERMLVIVTADHGEMLLEHGDTLHGQPWREVLEVPLIVRWPRGARAGRRTGAPTSALDIAPTLLAAAGVGHEDLPGSDLRHPPRHRPIAAVSGWWALHHKGFKAVGGIEGATEIRLFDVEADAGEQFDRAAQLPEVTARFHSLAASESRRFEALRRRLAAGADDLGTAQTPLAEEEERRLRSLGYLD